jgi:hypothetical protein
VTTTGGVAETSEQKPVIHNKKRMTSRGLNLDMYTTPFKALPEIKFTTCEVETSMEFWKEHT